MGRLEATIILRRVAALPSQPHPGPFTNGPYDEALPRAVHERPLLLLLLLLDAGGV